MIEKKGNGRLKEAIMVLLNEGLNVSLKIFVLIKKDKDLKKCRICVSCFQNGREMGLTFTNLDSNSEMTYCVYEHRNSDDIIINGKKNWTGFAGDLPYIGKTKYDYIASFRAGQINECFLKLKELLLKGY